MMNGRIGVQSEPGLGSTFWFTAVFDQDSSPETQSACPKGHFQTSATLRRARILVAEDNAVNREVVTSQLRKLGYQADSVDNGAAAVDAVEGGGYDLVLMDCQMPVMDGFEATLRIRGSKHAEIPIVAITAYAMASDRDRCLHSGMSDYLAKPVDFEQLAVTLAKWLPAQDEVTGSQATAPQVVNSNGAAVFNPGTLLQRLMGDRELARAMLRVFFGGIPEALGRSAAPDLGPGLSRRRAASAVPQRSRGHGLRRKAACTRHRHGTGRRMRAGGTMRRAFVRDDCRVRALAKCSRNCWLEMVRRTKERV